MIKFLVMDVDGTLTDGKIYMGVEGEAFKAFDIKDGYALHTLLKEHGIIPVIITARKSPMVEHRCKELGVTEIHQGIMNKLDCLKSILEKYSSADQQYDLSNVAYIGDDLLDLQCMKPITGAGGIAGCPSNAVKEVIAACSFVAPNKGGEGAVRDFAEYLISENDGIREHKIEALKERIDKAIAYISALNHSDLKPGKYVVSEDFYYTVQEYKAFSEEDSTYESHSQYVDVQWLISGKEALIITDVNYLTPIDEYDTVNDVIHYGPSEHQTAMLLTPGSCAVLFPKDAHKPARFLGTESSVKKIVGKVKV